MDLILTAAARTFGFVGLAVTTGFVIGVFGLGLLLAIGKVHLGGERKWSVIEAVADVVTTVLECFPTAVVLLVLSAALPRWYDDPWWKIFVMATITGVFWSASFARTVASAVETSFRRNYPTQMVNLGLAPYIDVVLKTILLRESRRNLVVSAVNLFTYGIVIDSGIGFILEFASRMQTAAVYYYPGSLGEILAASWYGRVSLTSATVDTAIFWPALMVALAGVVGLSSLSQHLVAEGASIATGAGWNRERKGNLVLGLRGLRARLPAPSHVSLVVGDLDLTAGDVAWVTGPSGSGKSLFFKTLVSVVPEGTNVCGTCTGPGETIHAQTELVFQEPAMYLYPYLPVGRFLRMFGGKKFADQVAKGPRSHILSLFVKNCSAGEKRLVANGLLMTRVAGDLAPEGGLSATNSKRLLLCDEPDASLDPANKEKWLADLRTMVAGKGNLALVYISHDPEVGSFLQQRLGGRFRRFVAKKCVLREDVVSPRVERAWVPLGDERAEPLEDRTVLNIRDMTVPSVLKEDSGKPLIDRVSLSLGQGERVAIIGHNGVGKSTLLRAIMNLIPRDFGEEGGITYRGEDGRVDISTWDFFKLSKIMAYLYDDNEQSFPPSVKVGRFVSWYCRRNRIAKNDFLGTLDGVGLGRQALEKYPLQLSGGQRQLLAFSLVYSMKQRRIVLIDEPFSRLDDAHQERLIDLIKEDEGRSYLMITHVGTSLRRLDCRLFFLNTKRETYFG